MVYSKSIVFFILLISSSLSFGQNFYKYSPKDMEDFKQIRQSKIDYFKTIPQAKGNGNKPFRRWEDFWYQRTFKSNSFPNTYDLLSEFKKYEEQLQSKFNYKNWTSLGPSIVPKNTLQFPSSGLGRISCLAVDPTDFKKLFAGAASGGLWVSSNEGQSWDAVNFVQVLSIGISDITFSKSNPKVIYAATGDADGVALSRNYSLGVIKSTDGGTTWNIADLKNELKENLIINKIIIDPSNENKVFLATNNGIYFSEDGCSTTTQLALNYSYVKDIAFKPFNPSIMYAAGNSGAGWSIFKSINKGQDWTSVLKLDSASRIAIGISPLNSNLMYAIAVNRFNGGFLGFYISTDSGDNWTLQSNSPNILGTAANGSILGGQGNYDLCIAPSMYNQNTVYIGGINMWKSNDNGKTWILSSHWSGENSVPFVHADHHDLLFSQTGKLYSCNDGGISISADTGTTWTDISYGLGITQVYRLGVYPHNEELIICGTQDNGTLKCDGVVWSHIFGGDGTECFYNPDDKKSCYYSLNNGAIYYCDPFGNPAVICINEADTKQKANWITPFAMHPDSIKVIYAGYYDIWKSSSYGEKNSWTKISNFGDEVCINHIAISENDPNIIYAAKQNKLYRSTDGGYNWQLAYGGDLYITYIAIDENSPMRAWITFSGYEAGQKVLLIDNFHDANYSGSLPNIPVNCIVKQNNSDNILYIGTDLGVFWYNPIIYDWQEYGYNIPQVVISDLEIHNKSNKLFAGTFGRGVYKTDLVKVLRDSIKINAQNKTICYGDSTLLSVNTIHRVYWANGDTTAQTYIKNSGKYFAIAINDYGNLLVSDTVMIDIIDSIDARVLSNKSNYCKNDTLILYSNLWNFENPFTWNNGVINDSINVTEAGNYYYTFMSENGCKISSDTIHVAFEKLSFSPTINRIENTLYAIVPDTNGIEYNWYFNNNILNEHKDYLDISQIGLYKVEICKGNCCTFSDEFNVQSSVNESIKTKQIKSIITTNKSINIELDEACQLFTKYSLFDTGGRELLANIELEQSLKPYLSIKDLSVGTFYLYLYCKDTIFVYKILVL